MILHSGSDLLVALHTGLFLLERELVKCYREHDSAVQQAVPHRQSSLTANRRCFTHQTPLFISEAGPKYRKVVRHLGITTWLRCLPSCDAIKPMGHSPI